MACCRLSVAAGSGGSGRFWAMPGFGVFAGPFSVRVTIGAMAITLFGLLFA